MSSGAHHLPCENTECCLFGHGCSFKCKLEQLPLIIEMRQSYRNLRQLVDTFDLVYNGVQKAEAMFVLTSKRDISKRSRFNTSCVSGFIISIAFLSLVDSRDGRCDRCC